MKNTAVLVLLTAISALFASCMKNDPEPGSPIFEGTSEIKQSDPSADGSFTGNGTFTYNVPSEVKYIVFGLFNAPITTSGKTITNPSAFLYGSRDGLSDFARGQQARNAFHSFNQTARDVDSTVANPPNGIYYWAIWGYDQYGNITHSSRQRKVTLN